MPFPSPAPESFAWHHQAGKQDGHVKRAMKTAFITGAGKRIGAKIASHLASSGYHLAVHYYQSQQEANILVEELNDLYGIKAIALAADLTNPVQVENVWQQATAQFSQIDLLINNAAWFDPVADQSSSIDANTAAHAWQLNTVAPLQLSQLFAAQQTLAAGHIINILDYRVIKPSGYFPLYTATKAALWSLTQNLALAYAPKIRVNGLALGMALKAAQQSDAHFAKHVAATPLQHSGDSNEIAKAILMLDSLPSVTGQLIALDGGMHLSGKTL